MAVVAAAEDTPRRHPGFAWIRWRWFAAITLVLAAAAAGWAGVAYLAPDPNAQLLRNLPVLENLAPYRQVESSEFLRMLQGERIPAEGAAPPEPWPERIADLKASQKDELQRRREEFDRLSAGQQQRLRHLHQQLCGDPDAEKLRETMNRYCQWLSGLPPYERAQLLELDPAQRIKLVRQIVKEQNRGGAQRLDAKDQEAVARWIDQYATANESRLLEALSKSRRRALARLAPAVRHRIVLGMVCQRWQTPGKPLLPARTPSEAADLAAGCRPRPAAAWGRSPAANNRSCWHPGSAARPGRNFARAAARSRLPVVGP